MENKKGWQDLDTLNIPVRNEVTLAPIDCTYIEPIVSACEKKDKYAYLVHENSGHMILLGQEDFFIGKAIGCNYRIMNDATISRKHALIQYEEDQYHIYDTDSGNHIYLDDKQVKDFILENGMKFRLSKDQIFQFVIEEM